MLTVAELRKQTSLLTSVELNTGAAIRGQILDDFKAAGSNTDNLIAGSDSSQRDVIYQEMDLNNNGRISMAEESYYTVKLAVEAGTLSQVSWAIKNEMLDLAYSMIQEQRVGMYNPMHLSSNGQRDRWISDYFNLLADGSHATGLANVPFDDYRANLHKGEAVIDARTMQGMRKYGIASNNSSNAKLEQLLSSINNKLDNLKSDDDSKHQIVSSLVDIKDTLEEWNAIGMPAPQEQLQ